MTIADAVKRPDRRDARKAPARNGVRASARGDIFKLSASPSHLLRRVEQFAAEIFLKSDLPDGVTLRQSVLLAAINEAEGASQSDLVRTTGVDRSTLAEMMARMERKGLIARSAAADDGRAKSVSLTHEGRKRLDAALPAMRMVDAELLAALPANKRAGFGAALLALSAAADKAHVEADDAGRQEKKAARTPVKSRKKRRKKTRR